MEIHITWCTEDVLETAKEMNVKLTEEEADEVLFSIESNHDACFGVSWDNIEWGIIDIIEQRGVAKNESI
tara:strand:+ start:3517 stop:3726 length:210 start_codon:yes stop_codon:yes gene_type:complete